MNKIIFLLIFSTITCQICDLSKYGAPHKDKGKDSLALEKSLQDCKFGGIILFPKGEYILKPFNFTSHQTLLLQNAYIHASTDPQDWPIIQAFPSYETGREVPNKFQYSSFISAWNSTNVSIKGEGIIDGHGMAWWYKYYYSTLQYTRGILIEFVYSQNILIEGVELRYSPFWTIHLYDSENILIEHIKIYNPIYGPNTDGVDPDSSRNIIIRNCLICTGDDHVAIKSGWNLPGRLYGKPSENITIINNILETGFGITIGSEVAGGVKNVLIENNTFTGCTWAVKFKAGRDDGGIVENIKYNNIHLNMVGVAISIDEEYRKSENDKNPPKLRNLTFSNISGFAFKAGHIGCLENSHCENLNVKNVDLFTLFGYDCEFVDSTIENNNHPKFC